MFQDYSWFTALRMPTIGLVFNRALNVRKWQILLQKSVAVSGEA
jgi:hypothetical protein